MPKKMSPELRERLLSSVKEKKKSQPVYPGRAEIVYLDPDAWIASADLGSRSGYYEPYLRALVYAHSCQSSVLLIDGSRKEASAEALYESLRAQHTPDLDLVTLLTGVDIDLGLVSLAYAGRLLSAPVVVIAEADWLLCEGRGLRAGDIETFAQVSGVQVVAFFSRKYERHPGDDLEDFRLASDYFGEQLVVDEAGEAVRWVTDCRACEKLTEPNPRNCEYCDEPFCSKCITEHEVECEYESEDGVPSPEDDV